MRKLLLALLLLLVAAPAVYSQVGPGNQILCNRATSGSATATIATSATARGIFVCGWSLEASAAAAAWALSHGTGSVCGTGTTQIMSAQAMGAGVTLTDRSPFAAIQIPAANNLCVTTSTTTNWIVYWGQF